MSDVENILAAAEQLPDPQARALVRELATAMIALIDQTITRAVEHGADPRKLADDGLVGNLMVLCDRHPDPPAVRADKALREATRELASCDVAFDRVEPRGAGLLVRVTVERGAEANPERVRATVDAIVASRAPDVDVEVAIAGRTQGFVPVDRITTRGRFTVMEDK